MREFAWSKVLKGLFLFTLLITLLLHNVIFKINNNMQPDQVPLQVPPPGHDQMLPAVVSDSSHPCLALLHIVLKIIIVGIFLLLPWFVSSLVVLEIVVILAAVDYWIVKNLAGRLLVGLRWWVDFDEMGEEHWKFQCKVNEQQNNPANQKIFWWTLALFTLIWGVFLVINVLKLDIQNVTICGFCTATLAFNLYSFYKCSKVQSENVKKLAAEYGTNVARRFLTGSIIANFI